MNEEQKRQVAIFRFGVIHDFVGGVRLDRGEQQRLLREKCERRWSIPHSQKTRLTRSTVLRLLTSCHISICSWKMVTPRKK